MEETKGKLLLKLFVAGLTPRSLKAINNVKKLCEKYLKDGYELEIIDIYQQPSKASEEQIIAVPTLIKELPLPLKRFVGDMSSEDTIIAGLFIKK